MRRDSDDYGRPDEAERRVGWPHTSSGSSGDFSGDFSGDLELEETENFSSNLSVHQSTLSRPVSDSQRPEPGVNCNSCH